jgi:hypothetical protein
MTFEFKSPKYWREMRDQRRKLQASSSKPEDLHVENSNRFVEAASAKDQAPSSKPEVPSSKPK